MRIGFSSIRGRCAAIIVLAGASLIGVVGAAVTSSGAPSDADQLIANEKAWAKAAVDGTPTGWLASWLMNM